MNTLYIARGLTTGRIKIGCTQHVDRRLRTLVSTAEPLELLAVLPGDFDDEAALHARFAALRASHKSREWFDDDGSIAAFIATLPEGQRGSREYRTKRAAYPRRNHNRRPPTPAEITAMEARWREKYTAAHSCLRGDAKADCRGCRRLAGYKKASKTRAARMEPIYAARKVNPFRVDTTGHGARGAA